MTIRAGFFSNTTSHAATNAADSFTVAGANESKHAFLVQSDIVTHIERSGADAAPATSLRIPANTIVLINTVAGDVISFIRGAAESADGTIWFTEVDH